MKKEITKQLKIPSERLEELRIITNIPKFKENIQKDLNSNITNLLETILGGAIFLESSDIHFEPQKEKTVIRTRVDGILQDVIAVDLNLYLRLLSRIKLLSGIKLNITQRPQDGRFSVVFDGNIVEIRASTLPSEYGESTVLRILNPKNLIEIEGLGLRKDLLDLFQKEIKKPNRMIIVTGPTGSGKTTTLYAFLKEIQTPEIKIITIEDPIEYHINGISQTQVAPKKGYSFASGLRSIVRQDPDVILVGEIRDLETAQIALQAALTGHLVLTTLHTNDAAGVIPRLVALGAKPANIAPALNLAIAQRLVRKVCPYCIQLKTASDQELPKLKKHLRGISKKIKIPPLKKGLKIPKTKGCPECNFTGYKGRTGIFEGFVVDPELENFILKSPSITELRKKILKKGMITMYQDGLLKVLNKQTTIEEVERVTTS